MPIIKQAIKRARQALVRRSRNLQVKRAVKQDITALHTALTEGEAKQIQTKLSEAYSEIDRAVKKHTLHKNTAARRKSALAHAVAKASGAEAVPAEAKTTKGAGKKAATTKNTTKSATKKSHSHQNGSRQKASRQENHRKSRQVTLLRSWQTGGRANISKRWRHARQPPHPC